MACWLAFAVENPKGRLTGGRSLQQAGEGGLMISVEALPDENVGKRSGQRCSHFSGAALGPSSRLSAHNTQIGRPASQWKGVW